MASRLKIPFLSMGVIRSFTCWLQYRYLTFGKTLWAKMHFNFCLSHNFLFSVHKRTKIKLVKNITFSLGFKVFKLCNFCFEKHYLFVARTNSIAKSKAVGLKGD